MDATLTIGGAFTLGSEFLEGGSGMQTEKPKKKMFLWNCKKSEPPLSVPLIYNLKMYT